MLTIGIFRSEFTKKIVKPAMGESGIGGSMAIYGAADAIVSFFILHRLYVLTATFVISCVQF